MLGKPTLATGTERRLSLALKKDGILPPRQTGRVKESVREMLGKLELATGAGACHSQERERERERGSQYKGNIKEM